MAPRRTPEQVLAALDDLQAKHEISILKLSETISGAASSDTTQHSRSRNDAGDDDGARTSDVSTSSLDALTPASLEADLAHYKELFAKLRFSYVEQVTKEKFIRAIVGDPPLIVSAQENADLERSNAAAKAQLKARKAEVADTVAALGEAGRDLARRHERAQAGAAALRELPAKTAALEARAAELRAERDSGADGGENISAELRLPLAPTLQLVEERKAKAAELSRQLEQLKTQAPRKRKEMERLQAELGPLEAKRQNITAAAREAQRRKEAALGGVEDDLEERGRWWRAQEAVLRRALDLQG